MTGMMEMMGGPMIAVMVVVWLLVVAFLVLGIAAFAKYLFAKNRP